MALFYTLLILLLVTRAFSGLAARIGQPALVGELIGGILLGMIVVLLPDSHPAIEEITTDKSFEAILDLAVFFLMLVAGVEMRPRDLAGVAVQAVPIAAAGMALPLLLGFLLGWWWLPDSAWKFAQSLFLAVSLAITAVPVAVKVLMDLGRLQSRVGRIVVAAAVIDDVFSLMLLAVLTALLSTDQAVSPGLVGAIALNVGLFFAIAWTAGRYLLPRLGAAVRYLNVEYVEFTLVIVYGLALSLVAELLHMHFLIGAFAAGVMFTRNVIGEAEYTHLKQQLEAVTIGFLAPIFFASIGIHLNLSAIAEIPLFALTLIAFAIIGKLAGAGVAAAMTGLASRDALAIGAAMNARGAVEIIIADIALRAGLFEHPDSPPAVIRFMFSAVVIMAIVTTLLSPLMLRMLLRKEN